MNFRQLEIFCAMMRLGSVSECARALGVTQPAVSKALRLMREETGLPLFERINGRMRASAEAEQIYAKTRHIFTDLERVEDFVNELRNLRAGKLRIAALATLSTTFVPRAASRLLESRPNVELDLRSLPSLQVLDRIAEHEADIGVFHEPRIDPRVRTDEICETEVVCVLAKDHPLVRRSVICPEDLVDEPVIAFDPDTSITPAVAACFRSRGLPFRPRMVVNQTTVAFALVTAGAGVALVDPFPLFGGDTHQCEVRAFEPTMPLRLRLAYPRERPTSRLAQEFAGLLRRSSEELAATAAFRLEML